MQQRRMSNETSRHRVTAEVDLRWTQSHTGHISGLRGPVTPTNGQQMINGMTATLGDHAI